MRRASPRSLRADRRGHCGPSRARDHDDETEGRIHDPPPAAAASDKTAAATSRTPAG